MSVFSQIPKHIAMIMDGNGRWAQSHQMNRSEGHIQGAKRVNAIVTYCSKIGVQYLTLYAFSVQNWGRPEDEVQTLMKLLLNYIYEEKETFISNQIRFETIGRINDLPDNVRQAIAFLKEQTKDFKGMTLTLALSYGGREELVEAMQKIAVLVQENQINPLEINAQTIQDHLYLPQLPDPDLMIRTSGELRISNFLIWQSAYTEFYFSNQTWPEFEDKDVEEAIRHYQKRERRFGLTTAQISNLKV